VQCFTFSRCAFAVAFWLVSTCAAQNPDGSDPAPILGRHAFTTMIGGGQSTPIAAPAVELSPKNGAICQDVVKHSPLYCLVYQLLRRVKLPRGGNLPIN
jgi:hypothetical protein